MPPSGNVLVQLLDGATLIRLTNKRPTNTSKKGGVAPPKNLLTAQLHRAIFHSRFVMFHGELFVFHAQTVA